MAIRTENSTPQRARQAYSDDRDEKRQEPPGGTSPSPANGRGTQGMTTTTLPPGQLRLAPDDHPERVLITVDELADMLGLSARTIWRMLSGGNMVEPVRIGKNVRWRLYEVRQWIDDGCPRVNRRNR